MAHPFALVYNNDIRSVMQHPLIRLDSEIPEDLYLQVPLMASGLCSYHLSLVSIHIAYTDPSEYL